MKLTVLIVCLCLGTVVLSDPINLEAHREKRSASQLADVAEGYIGSTEWSFAGDLHGVEGGWKCNMFVADVAEEAGVNVPHRRWGYSPIGAMEWANPSSEYLTNSGCWSTTSSPSRGDVAAYDGHMGIVASYGQTVSAAEYQVVKNDWGFRSYQSPVFWQYTC